MKTLEQIIELKKNSQDTLDGRDLHRLLSFCTEAQVGELGLTLKEEYVGKHEPTEEWTEEVVKGRLATDLDFAFEKALDQRGLSAGMMYSVIKMWCWVLDVPEGDWSDENYAQYGLPLFKAAALRFDLPNPIEGDAGDEPEYSEGYWHEE